MLGTEKTMPRLLFKDGISKLTDITASTNVGIMLTVVVLSLTSKGNHFFNVTLGPLKAQQMRYVFQQLLCYWMWLKKDFYWKAGDTIAKEAARTEIQTMLAQLVALWPRDRGQGWQTAKHHEQIHVPDDIDSLGAHQNYHTGSSEHNHIDNIKKPAKMTQGRKSVLDWQIANRRADAYILDLAYDAMKTKVPGFESKVDSGVQNGLSRLASKGIFELQRHPDRIDVNFGWTSESDPGRIPREISDYITLYFSRYHMLDSDTLQLPFLQSTNAKVKFFGLIQITGKRLVHGMTGLYFVGTKKNVRVDVIDPLMQLMWHTWMLVLPMGNTITLQPN